jgi:hypothetical protein
MYCRIFKVKVKDIDLDMLYNAVKLSEKILHPFKYDDIIFFYYKPIESDVSVEKLGMNRLLITVSLPYTSEYMVMRMKRELKLLYILYIFLDAIHGMGLKAECRLTKPSRIRGDGLIVEYSYRNEVKIAYSDRRICDELLKRIGKDKIELIEI